MLMDPEGNIKNLKEMLQICKAGDQEILILGLKSLVAVFKDIIPGYDLMMFMRPKAKDVFIPLHALMVFFIFIYLFIYFIFLMFCFAIFGKQQSY